MRLHCVCFGENEIEIPFVEIFSRFSGFPDHLVEIPFKRYESGSIWVPISGGLPT